MSYVDGFVLVINPNKMDEYKKIAGDAGKIWMEHGALAYKECMLEDANPVPEDAPAEFKMRVFKDLAGANEGETVVFSYILYKSREHRDEVNSKVMQDERMKNICPASNGEAPFDMKKMSYGGFKAFVDL